MDLKAWLTSLLKREPTEQELKEGSELVVPPAATPPAPTTPPAATPPVQTMQGVMGDSAIMQEMQEIKKTNTALLEKLNAEGAARQKADEMALAKAEANRKAAVEAKITEAKAKGIIPPDNKDAEANWRSLLDANFDSGVAVLMASTPINAGTPPAGDGQQNTGATNVGTKTLTPLEAALAGAEQAFKDGAAK